MLFAVTGTLYLPLELSPIAESRLAAALVLSVDSLPTWEGTTVGVERRGGAALIVVVRLAMWSSSHHCWSMDRHSVGDNWSRVRWDRRRRSEAAGSFPCPDCSLVGSSSPESIPSPSRSRTMIRRGRRHRQRQIIIARRRRPIPGCPPMSHPRPDIRRAPSQCPWVATCIQSISNVCSPSMDRLSELEAEALHRHADPERRPREEAMALLGELQDGGRKLLTLRRELRRLLDEG